MLWAIQTRLKAPKNQFNNFGKYKYRSCEDIIEGLKPLLAELKCSVTMGDYIQRIGDRYYVEAVATLVGPDGKEIATTKAFARESQEKKGMDESQITGAASSYARKYALNGLFLIDDNVDSDYLDNSKKYDSAVGNGVQQENPYKIEDLPKSARKGKKTTPTAATRPVEKVDPRPDLVANLASEGAPLTQETLTPENFMDAIGKVFEDSKPVEVGESMRYDTPVIADPLVAEFETEMNARMDRMDHTGSGVIVSAKTLDAFILYLKTKHKLVGTLEELKAKNVSSGKMDDLWDQYTKYLTK